jgi:hypothetical protein
MSELGPVGEPAPQITSPAEPYLGSAAILFTTQQALEGVHKAISQIAQEVHDTKRAHAGVQQLQDSWTNWLADPTQETLQPVLADLNDLQKISPQLHEEVLSFYEPADDAIGAYLGGSTTLGEVNGAFVALKNDPDRVPQWGRGITEAHTLEITSLQGAINGLQGAISALYGAGHAAFRAAASQQL